MSKKSSELRFQAARKRLSHSLQNLEEVAKQKIHDSIMQAKMIDVSYDHENNAGARLIEQASTIENLTREINNLQIALSQLGKESELVNSKNKILAQKIDTCRSEALDFIESIESDLSTLYDVIEINKDQKL